MSSSAVCMCPIHPPSLCPFPILTTYCSMCPLLCPSHHDDHNSLYCCAPSQQAYPALPLRRTTSEAVPVFCPIPIASHHAHPMYVATYLAAAPSFPLARASNNYPPPSHSHHTTTTTTTAAPLIRHAGWSTQRRSSSTLTPRHAGPHQHPPTRRPI
jgi:hypothetical protein